ncbi:hypothetical protein GNY06_11045 [Elizabethkingia argentiflava]|uniref:Uncharacterized protein n=2 Tax=Elizabethkingia argenteiflava TaxID=2681556 RepID=A0A845PZL9_9FLAO|nr:hypothetical protein [Elizabethkingia argenteiflava]
MRTVKHIAFLLIVYTTLTMCKAAPQEVEFLRDDVIHGLNDQIITGRFTAKNNLNIQHEINIAKSRHAKNYDINFSAYDKNGIAYYNIDSKGFYNGYVLVVPFEYKKHKDKLYLNFHGKNMKINYESNQSTISSNLGFKGNYLPSVFHHSMKITPKNSQKPELYFIKNFENEYPLNIDFFEHPVIKYRLEKLLKSQYASFIQNFKQDTPIIQIKPDLYTTSGCSDRKCLEVQEFIEIDVSNNKINVKIFNKKRQFEYKEP